MSEMGFTPNLVAGGSIYPFRLVKVSAAWTGIATSAITDYPVGVTDGSLRLASVVGATYNAILGDQISLQPSNTVQVEVGTGGATAGAFLMPLASGAGTVTDASGATAVSCYIALESGAAGDIIRAFRFGTRIGTTA
jgi:hypothetical protein